ncbi:hypothetical protein AVEN_17004-1 [Araneus ventricosus]|uniref:Uncharacterized protein n=1 Tax=Araneus ventricosus TaxID=182803 RepID=A0A4Y2SFP8_ARAVE|nr:hypothetical protein AVEN_17004-1 [Araneus ventricosus]
MRFAQVDRQVIYTLRPLVAPGGPLVYPSWIRWLLQVDIGYSLDHWLLRLDHWCQIEPLVAVHWIYLGGPLVHSDWTIDCSELDHWFLRLDNLVALTLDHWFAPLDIDLLRLDH